MTEEWYRDMASRIQSHRYGPAVLRYMNTAIVGITFLVYGCFLAVLFLEKRYELCYHSILVPAVAFVVLTIIRRLLHAKRPYERMDITPLIPREHTQGSFPSRHVFSIFIIAVTVGRVYVAAGIFLAVFGIILAVLRVVAGVHFVRDVVCGALIGILSACLGFYILF